MLRSKQRKTPARNFILVGVLYSNPEWFALAVFKTAFVELSLGLELIGSKQLSPVTVTGGLTRWKNYVIIIAHKKVARLSHYSIARKLNIHTTLKIV